LLKGLENFDNPENIVIKMRKMKTFWNFSNLPIFIGSGLFFFLLNNCKEEQLNKISVPIVKTKKATNITPLSFESGGLVSDDGGRDIKVRGVCWSTSENPVISSSKTRDSTGLGFFSSIITGLVPNTKYYYCAYASNGIEIGYGGTSFIITQKLQTPTLTTSNISWLNPTKAISGGNITIDGFSAVTERGVCWSTSPNPTINDSKTSDGSNIGSYISNISGLIANTTYFVRAYAINSAGTGYGDEKSFITPGSVTDIDGNTYTVVGIGPLIWMAENLKTTRYLNGDSIPNISDNQLWNNQTAGAYCNYNDDILLANIYGRLYNGYILDDPRKICPTGWHIPAYTDWEELIVLYVQNSGGKLKESGTIHWNTPNIDASNETGFTALPGGMRDNGYFGYIGIWGNWWSATELYLSEMRIISLKNNDPQVFINAYKKNYGLSIRCVKDL
jgi:uncharacterized protein (TIGR02145 family)